MVFETVRRVGMAEIGKPIARLRTRNPKKEPTIRARARKSNCFLDKWLLLSPLGSFRRNYPARGAGGLRPLAGVQGVPAQSPSFSRAAAGGARREALAPDMPGACQ